MTVRYSQIIGHLKIPPYPTHSDYYSLAIKFNILSLSNFFFRSVVFAGPEVIYKRHILIKLRRATRFFCIVKVTLTSVLKTFTITWQTIFWHALH